MIVSILGDTMTKKDIIYNNLKDDILKGKYIAGNLLPSEYEICEKYSVSREPVRRAIAKLREKGYIISKRGKGNIINPKEYYLHNSIASLSEEENDIKDIIVLELKKIENDNLFEDEEHLFKYKRIIFSKDNTIYEKGYLPFSQFSKFNIIDCKEGILEFIKQTHKIKVLKKVFNSILLDEQHIINTYLEQPLKTSIEVKQKLFDDKGKLIQYSIQIKKDSKFSYVTTSE